MYIQFKKYITCDNLLVNVLLKEIFSERRGYFQYFSTTVETIKHVLLTLNI